MSLWVGQNTWRLHSLCLVVFWWDFDKLYSKACFLGVIKMIIFFSKITFFSYNFYLVTDTVFLLNIMFVCLTEIHTLFVLTTLWLLHKKSYGNKHVIVNVRQQIVKSKVGVWGVTLFFIKNMPIRRRIERSFRICHQFARQKSSTLEI